MHLFAELARVEQQLRLRALGHWLAPIDVLPSAVPQSCSVPVHATRPLGAGQFAKVSDKQRIKRLCTNAALLFISVQQDSDPYKNVAIEALQPVPSLQKSLQSGILSLQPASCKSLVVERT